EIVGVGVASYIEPAALGWESGSLKVERSGRVTAITGSSAHGQGHETTFAQIVADHLGVTPDDEVVVHGDTRSGPEGFGTFGSRSVPLGGRALARVAGDVPEKGRRTAAKLLEAAAPDVGSLPGGFQVVRVTQRRAPTTCPPRRARRCTRPRRATHSAPKGWAKPAASPSHPRSSTPPWTRWRPSASRILTCRSRPRDSGPRPGGSDEPSDHIRRRSH